MEALLLKKKRTLNGHFSRPAETDPYERTANKNSDNSDWTFIIQQNVWTKDALQCIGGLNGAMST